LAGLDETLFRERVPLPLSGYFSFYIFPFSSDTREDLYSLHKIIASREFLLF
jgi:hypothetical protein